MKSIKSKDITKCLKDIFFLPGQEIEWPAKPSFLEYHHLEWEMKSNWLRQRENLEGSM